METKHTNEKIIVLIGAAKSKIEACTYYSYNFVQFLYFRDHSNMVWYLCWNSCYIKDECILEFTLNYDTDTSNNVVVSSVESEIHQLEK